MPKSRSLKSARLGGEEPQTIDLLVQSGAAERDAPLDLDYDSEDFHQDSARDSMRGLDGSLGLTGDLGGAAVRARPDFRQLRRRARVSLHEHLMAQAGERLSGTDLAVAAQIIEQIDEAGYFRARCSSSRSGSASAARCRARASSRPDLRSRRASPRAPFPNASPSRRRKRTATIPPWPG
jgi:hypothetical protein